MTVSVLKNSFLLLVLLLVVVVLSALHRESKAGRQAARKRHLYKCDRQSVASSLVDFDVPLPVGLELLGQLLPALPLGLGDLSKHLRDSRHHSLETAKVDVATLVEEDVKDLLGVFLDLGQGFFMWGGGGGGGGGEKGKREEKVNCAIVKSLEEQIMVGSLLLGILVY